MEEIISVYTDGSANSQKQIGAWAALIVNEKNENLLQGYAFNVNHQQMELQAVISALSYLNEQKDILQIKVFTDSQYVVNLPVRRQRLEENKFTSKNGKPVRNFKLLQKFYHLLDQIPVSFHKQPAHQKSNTGFDENRKVDKIARKLVREMCKKSQ